MSKVTPLKETSSESKFSQLKSSLSHRNIGNLVDEEYHDEDEGGYKPLLVRRKRDVLGIGSALHHGIEFGGLATHGISALGKNFADKSGMAAGVHATMHLTHAAFDRTGLNRGLHAVAHATGADIALGVAKTAAELARHQAMVAAHKAAGAASAGLGVFGVHAHHHHHGPVKKSSSHGPRHSSAKVFANSSHEGILKSPYPPPTSPDNALDVVEFEAVEYLCYENAKEVKLNVCRRGPCKYPVVLSYKNDNINFPKTIFEAVEGEVTLEVGERVKSFIVKYPDNDDFSVESLMDFYLTIKGDSPYAVLGDLRSCRVVVLNDDTFPHGATDMHDDHKVVLGFILHNFRLFRQHSYQGLFWKLIPGSCFVVNQIIFQQIIRTITDAYELHLEGGNVDAEQNYITIFGICYFVNFLLEYLADIEFTKLRLSGNAIKSLRVACMDTSIQLSSILDETFDVGRVMKTSEVAVENAVQNTWMGCFKLWSSLVKLAFMVGFLVYTAVDQAQRSGSPHLYSLTGLPFLMIFCDAILLRLNIAEASRQDLEAMTDDDEWSSFMVQSSFLRRVITTYRKGYVVTSTFEGIHSIYNEASYGAKMYTRQTRWTAEGISTAITAWILIYTGRAVGRGEMTVGAFVVFMSTVNSFVPTLGSVILEIFSIGTGYAYILRVANLLNSDTRRKQLLRGQIRHHKLLKNYKLKLPLGQAFDEDSFFMHDVTYRFSKAEHSLLPPLNCNIEGGQMVALQGKGSIGKKVVLRLMARHFIPRTGFIYYPSRWRYRFIDGNPSFFGGDMAKLQLAAMHGDDAFCLAQRSSMGTIEYNLKFGAQFKHPDPAVWDIEIFNLLQLLEVPEDLIGKNAAEFSHGIDAKKYTLIGLNGDRLSTTNRTLLSIARALLSSVDLLLMSNVLDLLGLEHSKKVFAVLRELCEKRALSVLATEAALMPTYLRKKKTVIFSTKLAELEGMADNWMHIGADDPTALPPLVVRGSKSETEDDSVKKFPSADDPATGPPLLVRGNRSPTGDDAEKKKVFRL